MKRDNLKLEIDSEEEVDNPDDKEDRYSKHEIKLNIDFKKLIKNRESIILRISFNFFCPIFWHYLKGSVAFMTICNIQSNNGGGKCQICMYNLYCT